MSEPDDLVFYGTADLTTTGALTMPKLARSELSMPPNTTVLVFGSPSTKKAIITASPDAQSLLDAVVAANSSDASGN